MLSEVMTCAVISSCSWQWMFCVDVVLYCNELVLNCAVNVEEHLQDRCMLWVWLLVKTGLAVCFICGSERQLYHLVSLWVCVAQLHPYFIVCLLISLQYLGVLSSWLVKISRLWCPLHAVYIDGVCASTYVVIMSSLYAHHTLSGMKETRVSVTLFGIWWKLWMF
jgi:hypothetical protein